MLDDKNPLFFELTVTSGVAAIFASAANAHMPVIKDAAGHQGEPFSGA